jgi:hypothetical protein
MKSLQMHARLHCSQSLYLKRLTPAGRSTVVVLMSRHWLVDHVSPRLSQPFVRPCHCVSWLT